MVPSYGVFTLPDTETETDKKFACTELRGGVHSAQRLMQISIRFCTYFGSICFTTFGKL